MEHTLYKMEDLRIIRSLVEDSFGFDIKVRTRKRHVVDARKIYFALSKEFTRRSLNEMGRSLNLDHSTALHNIRSCHDLLNSNDKHFESLYLTLKEEVKKYFPIMKSNNYFKYLGKEDLLQMEVINFIKAKYPRAMVVHIPNEGKRTPFEQYKLKVLGAVAGMPDIIIFDQNQNRSGLAIELKAGYNKPTENQKACLEALKMRNWATYWVNKFDDAKNIIDEYFAS